MESNTLMVLTTCADPPDSSAELLASQMTSCPSTRLASSHTELSSAPLARYLRDHGACVCLVNCPSLVLAVCSLLTCCRHVMCTGTWPGLWVRKDHLPTKKASPCWQISSKGKVTGRQLLDSLALGSDVSRTSCPASM